MAASLIPALIEHKFELPNFPKYGLDQPYLAPPQSVVHNNVRLQFTLMLYPNQVHPSCKDWIGVAVAYTDGPKAKLAFDYDVFVVKSVGVKRTEHMGTVSGNDEVDRGKNEHVWGIAKGFPRNLHKLASSTFLSSEGRALHVTAQLLIPESAFEDPERKCQVTSNNFTTSLYEQIQTPLDTASAYNFERFHFISNDDVHFYVHKGVLAFSSDVFRQIFENDKPPEAQFSFIREGSMRIENLSGGALREMFSYIYLGHTTANFGDFALETVEAADMFCLQGLLLLCEQELGRRQVKKMKDLDTILHHLQVARAHNLSELAKICEQRIKELVTQQNQVPAQLPTTQEMVEVKEKCENDLERK